MTPAEFNVAIVAERPRLMRYARKLTRDVGRADDLVQDAMVRALDKRELFQPGTDFRAWLFTILHNTWVNGIRRRAQRGGDPVELTEFNSPSIGPAAEANERVRRLRSALALIPQEMRDVLLIVAEEGELYGRAAQILDVPVGTVRSRLSRGRALLREMLGAS